MITFEYRFDVLPGKQKEYEKYTAGPGKDVWRRFRGVRDVRVYRSMLGGSSPQRIVQVDLENLAALERILADPGFQKIKGVFHSLVTNVSDSLLVRVAGKGK